MRPVRLVGVHCEEVRLVNRVVVSPEGDNVVALHPAKHVPEVGVLVGGPEAGEAKGRALVVVEGGGGKGGGGREFGRGGGGGRVQLPVFNV